MKRLLIIFIAAFVCVVARGQKAHFYNSKLNVEQLRFRNYSLGAVVPYNDSLTLISEPIFDRIYFSNKFVIGDISIGVIDGQGEYFGKNHMWTCFSRDLNLKFIFPIGTEAVAFSNHEDIFYYTTHVSTGGDCWYNRGVVNSDGVVLCSAANRCYCYVYNDYLFELDWHAPSENAVMSLSLVKSGIVKEHVNLSASYNIASFFEQGTEPNGSTVDEQLFFKAFNMIPDGKKLDSIIDAFLQCEKESSSKIVSDNSREILSLLRCIQ